MDLAELRQYSELLIQEDERIRSSEQNLITLFQNITDFIFIIDAVTHTVIDVNKSVLDTFGYTIDEIKGKHIYDLHPDRSQEDIDMCFMDDACSCEVPFVTKEGKEIPSVTKITKFIWDDNDAYVCIARDMTERFAYEAELNTRNMELEVALEELRNTEDELKSQINNITYQNSLIRAMCDNVPDMIWAKDVNNNYIFANQAIAANLLNATSTSEPLGKDDLYFAERERLLHPNDPNWHTFGEICKNSDEIVLREKKTRRFQEFGNVKGKFVWLDVYKSPFFFGSELIGVVGSGRDVTEEQSLTNAMISQKNFLEALLENLPLPIFYKDMDGKFIDANGEFCNFYGASLSYIIGKTTQDLFPEDAKYLNEKEEELKKTGRVKFYYDAYDKHMVKHRIIIIKTLHHDANGKAIGIIGCGIGIAHTALMEGL